MQETLLADPTPPLHQLGMLDRDLLRRPAEAHEGQLQPEAVSENETSVGACGDIAPT
jgi:hypothetical protein